MRHWTVLAVLLLVGMGLAGCANTGGDPQQDSLGDGLPDLVCVNGWDITISTPNGTVTDRVTCDPMLWDTNGDGMTDVEKFTFGLDPRSHDTDQDGLTDCQEVVHTVRAECEDPDFEGPFDGGYGTDPKNWNTDGGGLPDGMQVNGFWIELPDGRQRFVTTDPLRTDTDRDGLSDCQEVRHTVRAECEDPAFLGPYDGGFGTDPTNPDTDGDGCMDGFDPYPTFEEMYGIHFHNFTLLRGKDAAGGVNLFLQVVFLEQVRILPADGTLRVQVGQTINLEGLWGEDIRPSRCEHWTTSDPWGYVQVAAYHEDSEGRVHRLDIESNVDNPFYLGPQSLQGIFWHARDDRLNWQSGGEGAFGGPVEWTGVDGGLAFLPYAR